MHRLRTASSENCTMRQSWSSARPSCGGGRSSSCLGVGMKLFVSSFICFGSGIQTSLATLNVEDVEPERRGDGSTTEMNGTPASRRSDSGHSNYSEARGVDEHVQVEDGGPSPARHDLSHRTSSTSSAASRTAPGRPREGREENSSSPREVVAPADEPESLSGTTKGVDGVIFQQHQISHATSTSSQHVVRNENEWAAHARTSTQGGSWARTRPRSDHFETSQESSPQARHIVGRTSGGVDFHSSVVFGQRQMGKAAQREERWTQARDHDRPHQHAGPRLHGGRSSATSNNKAATDHFNWKLQDLSQLGEFTGRIVTYSSSHKLGKVLPLRSLLGFAYITPDTLLPLQGLPGIKYHPDDDVNAVSENIHTYVAREISDLAQDDTNTCWTSTGASLSTRCRRPHIPLSVPIPVRFGLIRSSHTRSGFEAVNVRQINGMPVPIHIYVKELCTFQYYDDGEDHVEQLPGVSSTATGFSQSSRGAVGAAGPWTTAPRKHRFLQQLPAHEINGRKMQQDKTPFHVEDHGRNAFPGAAGLWGPWPVQEALDDITAADDDKMDVDLLKEEDKREVALNLQPGRAGHPDRLVYLPDNEDEDKDRSAFMPLSEDKDRSAFMPLSEEHGVGSDYKDRSAFMPLSEEHGEISTATGQNSIEEEPEPTPMIPSGCPTPEEVYFSTTTERHSPQSHGQLAQGLSARLALLKSQGGARDEFITRAGGGGSDYVVAEHQPGGDLHVSRGGPCAASVGGASDSASVATRSWTAAQQETTRSQQIRNADGDDRGDRTTPLLSRGGRGGLDIQSPASNCVATAVSIGGDNVALLRPTSSSTAHHVTGSGLLPCGTSFFGQNCCVLDGSSMAARSAINQATAAQWFQSGIMTAAAAMSAYQAAAQQNMQFATAGTGGVVQQSGGPVSPSVSLGGTSGTPTAATRTPSKEYCYNSPQHRTSSLSLPGSADDAAGRPAMDVANGNRFGLNHSSPIHATGSPTTSSPSSSYAWNGSTSLLAPPPYAAPGSPAGSLFGSPIALAGGGAAAHSPPPFGVWPTSPQAAHGAGQHANHQVMWVPVPVVQMPLSPMAQQPGRGNYPNTPGIQPAASGL
ncbi:unnamed protein product [Amoebophrya sp. A120]|nr:unnamed protein product [Amoebophrya sp. A120]|eukprot:GSA120T00024945001.1